MNIQQIIYKFIVKASYCSSFVWHFSNSVADWELYILKSGCAFPVPRIVCYVSDSTYCKVDGQKEQLE